MYFVTLFTAQQVIFAQIAADKYTPKVFLSAYRCQKRLKPALWHNTNTPSYLGSDSVCNTMNWVQI